MCVLMSTVTGDVSVFMLRVFMSMDLPVLSLMGFFVSIIYICRGVSFTLCYTVLVCQNMSENLVCS